MAQSCSTAHKKGTKYSKVIVTLTPSDDPTNLVFWFNSGLGHEREEHDVRKLPVIALLKQCTHYTPKGYRVSDDGKSLTVFYQGSPEGLLKRKRGRREVADDLADSARRLSARIDDYCAKLNAEYVRNPHTHFVTKRVVEANSHA